MVLDMTTCITATNPSPSSHKFNTVLCRRVTRVPMNEMDLEFGKFVIFS